MKIKNIDKAADRIRQAINGAERIILYGDSDLDGIASVVIMEEAIKSLGGQICLVVFPDRENDGYGVNMRALEFLKDKAPALFITLDLGIGNVKEVHIANGMGFEVIIIDHHEVLNGLPPAKIIVNPRQEGDRSGANHLANAGIVLKTAEELLGENFSAGLRKSFYELAALATIADMVPQEGDNKVFIEEGLRSLQDTFRPGIAAFLEIIGKGEVAAGGYLKIISALNAAESLEFKNESYRLLTSADRRTCRELAETLLAKTQWKQQKIREITAEVERRVSQDSDRSIIFEGDPAWKLTLAGPVASIIAVKYQKPTFIFKRGDTESCGSVRSLNNGENSVDALKSCADILVTYGGHPKASGFRVKNEHLEQFKKRLEEYFKKNTVPIY